MRNFQYLTFVLFYIVKIYSNDVLDLIMHQNIWQPDHLEELKEMSPNAVDITVYVYYPKAYVGAKFQQKMLSHLCCKSEDKYNQTAIKLRQAWRRQS